MCMTCVGAVGTALQAATLIGGPIAYGGYRRVRARLGLTDTSVAAREAQMPGSTAPASTSRPIASTRAAGNWVPAQRRHSASASATVSGAW